MPRDYKIVCISLYDEDDRNLDELVGRLKAAGATRTSRSSLIRVALSQVDFDRALAALRTP